MGGSADGGRNTAHDKAANLSVAPPARPYFNGMSAVATKIIAMSCYAGSYARLRMCRNAGTLRRRKKEGKGIPLNYIRLLAGLRGGFQRALPGGGCALPGLQNRQQANQPATRTVGPRKRSAAGHSHTVATPRSSSPETASPSANAQIAASRVRYRYKALVSAAHGR